MMRKGVRHRSEKVDIIHKRVVFSEARAHRIFFFYHFSPFTKQTCKVDSLKAAPSERKVCT